MFEESILTLQISYLNSRFRALIFCMQHYLGENCQDYPWSLYLLCLRVHLFYIDPSRNILKNCSSLKLQGLSSWFGWAFLIFLWQLCFTRWTIKGHHGPVDLKTVNCDLFIFTILFIYIQWQSNFPKSQNLPTSLKKIANWSVK